MKWMNDDGQQKVGISTISVEIVEKEIRSSAYVIN